MDVVGEADLEMLSGWLHDGTVDLDATDAEPVDGVVRVRGRLETGTISRVRRRGPLVSVRFATAPFTWTIRRVVAVEQDDPAGPRQLQVDRLTFEPDPGHLVVHSHIPGELKLTVEGVDGSVIVGEPDPEVPGGSWVMPWWERPR